MNARSVWYQNLPPLDLTGQAGTFLVCEKSLETQVEKPPILPTLHILDDWIARISNKYAK